MAKPFHNQSQLACYSQANVQLLNLLQDNPILIGQPVPFAKGPDFMAEYEYPVANWPVMIDEQLKARFSDFNRCISGMLVRAIKHFFKDDINRFEQYLSVPGVILELINRDEVDFTQFLARHDIVFSNSEFKVLEVNAGSSIGGWQHDWLYHNYDAQIETIKDKLDYDLSYHKVMVEMFACVLNAVEHLPKAEKTGNILLTTGGIDAQYEGIKQRMVDTFAQAVPESLAGAKIIFCADLRQMQFDDDGNLTFDGMQIDGVLLTLTENAEFDAQLNLKLISSYNKRKIVLPDGPVHSTLGNKHLLTLLHEPQVQAILSEHEKTLVQNHIPWSVKLFEREVEYQGQTAALSDIVKQHKDDFVMKKAQSFQGVDVHVGAHTEAELWVRLVDELICQDDWMIQEFCQPDEVLMCNRELGIVPHQLVWGVFDFAGRYNGAFVRGVPVNVNNGVINSANGAMEFVVYESKPKAETCDVVPLLRKCSEQGIEFEVEDGQLDILFDGDELSDALLNELKQHKQAIIDFLTCHDQAQEHGTIKTVARNPQGHMLSSAQQRLWFVDKLQGSSGNFNMNTVVEVEGNFDLATAEAAIQAVVARHEILRSVYFERDGVPYQRLNDNVTFTIDKVEQAAGLSTAALFELLRNDCKEPFDLKQDLMIRVRYYPLGEQNGVLAFTVHHIACDGWSLGLIVNEFGEHYRALKSGQEVRLQPLPLQYIDYAEHQREYQQSAEIKAQLQHLLAHFDGAPHHHGLPLDKPRKADSSHIAGVIHTRLPQQTQQRLSELAVQKQVTLFMMLHALVGLVLARHSNRDDIVIGTPAANRQDPSLETLVGFFVNTLALRSSCDYVDFDDYLAQVKQVNLDALANQNVLLEQLADGLNIPHNSEAVRLTQIVLTLNNYEVAQVDLPGVSVRPWMALDETGAKFDLEISAAVINGELQLKWIYDADLFAKARIEQMAENFELLVASVLADSTAKLADLNLLSAQAKAQLIAEPVNAGEFIAVSERFEHFVQAQPQAEALVCGDTCLSYEQLAARVQALAQQIARSGSTGPVGILLETGIDLIVSFLAIQVAGRCCVPLDPNYPQSRLNFMISDSGVDLLLCKGAQSGFGEIATLSVDEVPSGSDITLTRQQADNTAYIIYTSGTTGTPKGVVVSQANWSAYIDSALKAYECDTTQRLLQFSSPSFDIFIEELSLSLLCGGTLVLRPEPQLPGSAEFWQWVADYQVSIVSLPTAYWHQLCRDENLNQHSAQTSLSRVIVGGEALQLSDLKLWQKAPNTQSVALFNSYGPTETTVIASCYKIDKDADISQYQGTGVPIGQALENTNLYVLDKAQNLAPLGAVGYLYVAGPQVAQGYLNREADTNARFVTLDLGNGPQRMYHTGDLVRRLNNGELGFVGRADSQVKIRGFRVEPSEVERKICDIDGVAQAVVLAQKDATERYQLTAWVVAKPGVELSGQSLTTKLEKQLPEYMVPGSIVLLEKLPLNVNGKVDLKKLPQPNQPVEANDYQPPTSDTELVLSGIWGNCLGLPATSLGRNAHFFANGGDSLQAVRMLAMVEKHFERRIALRDFLRQPTVAELAEKLEQAHPVAVVVKPQHLETTTASHQQRRIWLLNQLDQDQAGAYNLCEAFVLRGEVDVSRLKAAFETIARRHQALRTRFFLEEQTLMQTVMPSVEDVFVEYPVIATEKLESELELNSRHEFDLNGECLMRVVLFTTDDNRQVLQICVHHIAADGWSVSLLCQELSTIYNQSAEALAPLEIQYSDYSAWQQTQGQGNRGLLLKYWKDSLKDLPDCHNLPLDHPRPAKQSYQGKVIRQALPEPLATKVKQFAQERNVTAFMVLQSAFAVLLARYSNERDIVMGTPVANREQPNLGELIGCFINTIVLRNQLSEDMSFEQLLGQSQERILSGFANQGLAFETLVEHMKVERNTAYSPLFQVMFVLHNNQQSSLALDGVELEHIKVEKTAAKFDLTLNLYAHDAGFTGEWEYNSALFEAESVAQMAEHFNHLIDSLLAEPAMAVEHVSLLPSGQSAVAFYPQGRVVDTHAIEDIHNLQSVDVPYSIEDTHNLKSVDVHNLFESWAAKSPEAIALIAEKEVSYGQLDRQANRLAHYLIEKGLQPQDKVAVMMEHSIGLLSCLLAVMKAGGCYVPVDSAAPAARLTQIIEDADIHLLLGDAQAASRHELVLDITAQDFSAYAATAPELEADPERSAYVLYTSGSTGKPKGVEVSHRAFANLLTSIQHRPGIKPEDRLLAVTATTFDIAGLELFAPLVSGATVVLSGRANATDGERLAQLIEQHNITLMQATPTMWRVLLDADWQGKSDLTALCGGEAINQELAEKLSGKVATLWNMYGPTETTIWSMCGPIDGDNITLGLPVDNTEIVVVDKHLAALPPGVPGQLLISGKGLAKGYLGRDDLTQSAFINKTFEGSKQTRWYTTGDMVRCNSQGQLHFLGRIDHQIKLRGFRIEPGEIESQFNCHPQVSDSLVLVWRDEQSAREDLVAYYVAKAALDVAEIRQHLGAFLPVYMMPSRFIRLDEFPLTSSGKKDRKQLPSPATSAQASTVFVAPNQGLESFIVDNLKQMLGVERIGATVSFFDVGATSLDLVELAQRLSSHLATKVSAIDLFDKNNCRALAAHLEQQQTIDTRRAEPTPQKAQARERLKARARRNERK